MENQWQPIQTAPKDGSEFLMFITGIKYTKHKNKDKLDAKTINGIVIAKYEPIAGKFYGRNSAHLTLYIDPFNYKDENKISWGFEYFKYDIQATHWTPLPKLPIINN